MARFKVRAEARIDREPFGGVDAILEAVWGSTFDAARNEVVCTEVVEAVDETEARSKVVGPLVRALEDAGLSFTHYTLQSRLTRLVNPYA